MNVKYFISTLGLLLLFTCLLSGCGKDPMSDGMAKIKELNSTNVFKVRTCFIMYEARTRRWPKSQEDLKEVLTSGKGRLDRALKRINVDPANFDAIFVSERDGKPFKIKWGIKMNRERIMPIVFEQEGVDGVRLVAADVLLEVDNDQEYDKLWKGDYVSKFWGDEGEDDE